MRRTQTASITGSVRIADPLPATAAQKGAAPSSNAKKSTAMKTGIVNRSNSRRGAFGLNLRTFHVRFHISPRE
ncbi:MAG: hypothetical protein JO243_21040 [Solirubrobacterales bacterium]|nr:hypothetical protein [Solirubrobacterales bacterium]